MLSYFINAKAGTSELIEVKDWRDYSRLLECDCIDIVYRYIGDSSVQLPIVIDDCGKLKDNPVISALNLNTPEVLVGSLLVINTDSEGEQIPLSQEHITILEKNTVNFSQIGVAVNDLRHLHLSNKILFIS